MATCPTCKTQYSGGEHHCPSDGAELVPDGADVTLDTDLKEGVVVGEYRIESKLGEGGFGSVYRAVHPVIGKEAAIKVLNHRFSADPHMVARFIAEARAVNQIRHRGIIDIFSFGKLEDGRQYYVMELLAGMPFDAYLGQRGRLPVEEALPILRGISRALDAAHAAGIAHRDLKPENVFLAFDEDGTVYPKLLDFGIAKLLGDSTSGHKTRTGVPIGTPLYMSPEQCRGRNIDHRTDIYAFGVMCFEVLTGTYPFQADDVMDIMIKHVSEPAPRVSELCPDLRAELDAPVLAMLEKDPAQRPPSMGAAMEGLMNAAKEAGYSVSSLAVRSSEYRAPGSGKTIVVSSGPRGVDPNEQTLAGDATTLSIGAGAASGESVASTLRAAGEPAANTSGIQRKTIALAGGVAALIALGAVAWQFAPSAGSGALPETGGGERGAGPGNTVALVDTSIVSAAGPAGASAVVPQQPAPEAKRIKLSFDSSPPDTDVMLGDEKLGSAAEPIWIDKSEQSIELIFVSKGYQPWPYKLTPLSDTHIKVSMKAVAAGKPVASAPTKPSGAPSGSASGKPNIEWKKNPELSSD